jgi:hypothetical protein
MNNNLSFKMSNNGEKVVGAFGVIWIGIFITAMVYIVDGNAYEEAFTGTLKEAHVIDKTDCKTNDDGKTSCSEYYYVGETFYKGNSDHTCLVTRPTRYYFEGDAESNANSKKLGTKRKIWTTYYSHGTCYDEKIRYLYNCIGISLLCIDFIVPVSILIWFFYYSIKEFFRKSLCIKTFRDWVSLTCHNIYECFRCKYLIRYCRKSNSEQINEMKSQMHDDTYVHTNYDVYNQ